MLFRDLFGRRNRAILHAATRSLAVIEFALDGTILDANDNFLRAMGYTLPEIRGRKHAIFVDPAQAASAEYRVFWEELRQGRHKVAEFRRLAKGGREVWIQASYTPILDRGGKPVGVAKFAMDVTQAKLQAISDQAQVASICKSQAVIRYAMDGTIKDANELFLKAAGYSNEEIVGQNHRMLVFPEQAASREYFEFWERLRQGEYVAGEYKRRGKHDREIWIMAAYTPILGLDGKPTEVVAFATDITESKLRNADFQGQIEAINRSQATIEFKLDGTILAANGNFLRAMGYDLAEIRGKHHSIFVEPDYVATPDYKAFWAKLQRGEFHAAIYKRLGKGGRVVWISASYNPVLDLDGKPCKVVKFATDITVRMEARSRAIRFADETLNKVRSVAAAVEEMSASAAQIAETMQRSHTVVDEITRQAGDANLATQRLRSAASSMDQVVQLIRSIASNISLLSLNATIESARAGEAGKGFAVVANEVKQLANQTTAATQQVAQEIEAMQLVSSEVASALGAIGTSVESLLQFVSAASGAVQEQSSATLDISSNMQAASTDVAGISRSLSEGSEQVA
ncbi:PAS domain-containing methyl-accepting chemotaxis protein [Roseomonas sp. E05]|uniref:methyl-accepting chemotaxis protein n=1 Tax=Roseomonas sp. E05 TaxID=3046310 RepID=UPI0024BA5CB3|nr:PAS domain-containing methyl-accepting chemotaxis protein [Roseomonas sp. E05]MDJ0387115.1 PAS domain-containing methyl-accepting chemotaxis protein [Roseomonas sp. E05]